MSIDDPNSTNRLVALIRDQGRWPTLAIPLVEALEVEAWRREGFPSPTAWLDRMAALGGRSTTYLSRCVSAARFLNELKMASPSLDLSRVWSRPLSAIEEFRRRTGNDPEQIAKRLPQLSSGALTSYGMRQDNAQAETPRKAERMGFEEIALRALEQLLSQMGYPSNTKVLVEPRTPVGRPDMVFVDSTTGSTTIVEVKSDLSRRKQNDLVQQLLAYSSLGQKVWLVLPSDSKIPGETIIENLRRAAIRHVGLLLLDPTSAKITYVMPPEIEADENESRAAFKNLVLASERTEA